VICVTFVKVSHSYELQVPTHPRVIEVSCRLVKKLSAIQIQTVMRIRLKKLITSSQFPTRFHRNTTANFGDSMLKIQIPVQIEILDRAQIWAKISINRLRNKNVITCFYYTKM